MSEDAPQQYTAPNAHPPVAPPVMAHAVAGPRQSAWPMAVGVIAVIFGCLGVFGGLSGLVSPMLFGAMDFSPSSAAGMPFDPILAWKKWTITLSAGGLLLSALLIVGSVGLLKRRASCRRTLLTYAVLALPHAIANTTVGYFVQQDTLKAMSGAQGMAPFGSSFQSIIGVLTIGFGLLWNLALPVFLLIWLNRRKIRQEVAGWSSGMPRVGPT